MPGWKDFAGLYETVSDYISRVLKGVPAVSLMTFGPLVGLDGTLGGQFSLLQVWCRMQMRSMDLMWTKITVEATQGMLGK